MEKTRASRQVRRWLALHGHTLSKDKSSFKKFGKWLAPFSVTLLIPFVINSLSAAGILNMSTAYNYIFGGWLVVVISCFAVVYSWNFPKHHKLLVCVSVTLVVGLMALGLAYWETEKRYELTHLVPDDLPSPPPPSGCNIPPNTFTIYLGDNTVFYTDKFPHDIIVMGKDADGKPYSLLRIDKRGDVLGVSLLLIFDENGSQITSLHEDEWWKNSNFRVLSTAHTLVAYNNQDQEVLNIYYLNNHTIYVTGLFIRPAFRGGVYAERITKNNITILSPVDFTLGSGCFAGLGTGGDVFHFD